MKGAHVSPASWAGLRLCANSSRFACPTRVENPKVATVTALLTGYGEGPANRAVESRARFASESDARVLQRCVPLVSS